jgi:hypothetical protein
MSLRNFINVVKRDVFKIKNEPKPTVVESQEQPGLMGWSYYLQIPPPQVSGINRQYRNYLPENFLERALRVNCSELGIQFFTTQDPMDYRQLYYFTNQGSRLIKIEWRGKTELIEPGETALFKINFDVTESEASMLPRITPLNGGF